jgi:hypothetical protein
MHASRSALERLINAADLGFSEPLQLERKGL